MLCWRGGSLTSNIRQCGSVQPSGPTCCSSRVHSLASSSNRPEREASLPEAPRAAAPVAARMASGLAGVTAWGGGVRNTCEQEMGERRTCEQGGVCNRERAERREHQSSSMTHEWAHSASLTTIFTHISPSASVLHHSHRQDQV